VKGGLEKGDLQILGLLDGASNYTLLAKLDEPKERLVVYKPRRGEAPLWDFPRGTLCQREVSACLLSNAAGWDLVPQTIMRGGPLGDGAVQEFVDHDPMITAFDMYGDHLPELRRICVFDLVVNNADRKAGHVIADEQGKIWAVDHGLCFHEEPKLRTVLWDFIGESIPPEDLAGVERIGQAIGLDLSEELTGLLAPGEVAALKRRVESMLKDPVFPPPSGGRSFPWPPI